MRLSIYRSENMNGNGGFAKKDPRHLMIDKNKLRTIMAEHKDNRKTLAEYLNISESTLSNKMNERKTYTFNLAEIRKMVARYHMTSDQIIEVFFNQ